MKRKDLTGHKEIIREIDKKINQKAWAVVKNPLVLLVLSIVRCNYGEGRLVKEAYPGNNILKKKMVTMYLYLISILMAHVRHKAMIIYQLRGPSDAIRPYGY